MVIDILVLICAVWALVLGVRRGLVVQLCHLVGLYIAILLAPDYASVVGSLIIDDPGKAYFVGFALIVVVAMLLIWIIAPLLRFIIVWHPVRWLDALLGGVLNIATMVIVTATLLSIFDRMNISDGIRQDRLVELMKEYKGREEELQTLIDQIDTASSDHEIREYIDHRYISYETLKESICFFPLSELGAELSPSIKRLDEQIKAHCKDAAQHLVDNIAEEHKPLS